MAVVLVLALLALAVPSAVEPAAARAPGGVIAVLAGTGGDYTGDGPVDSTGIGTPLSVAAAPTGGVYHVAIADRVLKVEGGQVTTVAGGGEGALVDGAAATSVALAPRRVEVGPDGTVYVSLATQVVSIAGGTIKIVGSGLTDALGLAVDATGAVYVADAGAHVVRRIAGGASTIVAGKGEDPSSCSDTTGDLDPLANCLDSPQDVTFLPDGDLLISVPRDAFILDLEQSKYFSTHSSGGSAVHHSVDPAGKSLVHSVKGSYVYRYRFDAHLGITGLYRDTDSRVQSAGTAAGNGKGGPAAEGVNSVDTGISPQDVAVDSNGLLLIADATKRIYGVYIPPPTMPQLVIETISGDGDVTSTGRVVSDGDDGPASAASVGAPADVAVGNQGEVYLTDRVANTIRRIDPTSGVITSVAGGGSGYTDGAAATSVALPTPVEIDVDPDGSLWVITNGNERKGSRLHRIEPDGTIHLVYDGGPSSVLLSGVAATGDGAALATVDENSTYSAVYRLTPGSGATDTCGGCATPVKLVRHYGSNLNLYHPQGIDRGPDGRYYLGARLLHAVKRLDGDGSNLTTYTGSSHFLSNVDSLLEGGPGDEAHIKYPHDVTVDEHGAVFVAQGDSGGIVRVDPASGAVTWVAGSGYRENGFAGDGGPAVDALLNQATGIAVSPDGETLYIADYGNNRIRKVTGFPPPSPRNVAATAGDAEVELSWSPVDVTDFDGYHLYRRTGSSDFTRLNDAPLRTSSGYRDSGVTNGTTYTYYVSTVDRDGHESAPSNQVTATPQPPPPPPPPPPPVVEEQSTASSVLNPSQSGVKKEAFAGDPVNLIFGNFTYSHTDLTMPAPGLPVALTRSYSSALPKDGILGSGWHLTWDLRITSEDSGSTLALTRGDGRIDRYAVAGDGTITAPAGSADVLTAVADGCPPTPRAGLGYDFDTAGRLLSAVDADGNTVTLGYSGDDWTGLTDSADRAWTLGYDGAGRVTSITDPGERTVTYTYDGSGDLVAVTNPAGNSTTYTYDGNHRMTSITDANGHLVAANTYDDDGRVIAQTDARGSHAYAYGGSFDADGTFTGGSTRYTDPEGGRTTVEYDSAYRLVRRAAPDGGSLSFTYGDDGLVSEETDANGNMTTYTYDARGNVTSLTDPLGAVTTMSYDSDDNLLSLTDANGETSHTYDDARHRLSTTDAAGGTTTYTYTERGQVETVTDASGATTTTTYDDAGNVASVTAADGSVTSFTYDATGRLASRTDPGGVTSYDYNAVDQLVSVTVPGEATTTFSYDAAGNRTSMTGPGGAKSAYVYSDANDLVSQTDPTGVTTQYDYDALGRRTSTTLADGTSWTTGYDAAGRRTSVTSPLGYRISYRYDGAGNVVSLTDQAGAETSYTYDGMSRLVGVTDALAGSTSYGYDGVGNLLTAVDARGSSTSYTYDGLGRALTATDALGNVSEVQYDAVGRPTAVTNGAGQTVTYTYDRVGRVLETSADGETVRYDYDAAGRRTAMTDPHGVTSYEYDEAGRLTSATSPEGRVEYGYDAAGNRTSVRTVGGKLAAPALDVESPLRRFLAGQVGETTTATHDAANRLTGLAVRADGADRTVVDYGYDAAGRLSTETFGNGVAATRSYDTDGRLSGLEVTGPDGVLRSIDYTLDARGLRAAESGTDLDSTYTYDALARLTAAEVTVDEQPHAYAYGYDAVGNRTSTTEDGATTASTYDEANRLVEVGGTAVSYDAAGRLTHDGTSAYSYDPAGRLTGVAGAVEASYRYDGDGNRIGETVNGAASRWLLDTGASLPTRLVTWGGDGTRRWMTGAAGEAAHLDARGNVKLLHGDGLGSIRLSTGDGGGVSGRADFAPFGAPYRAETGIGFTGEPQSGGLVHLRARDYHVGLGRFLTPDPYPGSLAAPQTRNPYPYVMNNPVNFVDPSGQCVFGLPCPEPFQAFGRAVRAVVDTAARAIQESFSAAQRAVASLVESGAVKDGTIRVERASADFASRLGPSSPGRIIATGGGNIIATGGLNIIATGGGNIIATGGLNIIATGGLNLRERAGGGNIIATGGLNIIATGGGNIIATGGGNLIGHAGGNIIATGGGN